MSQSTTDGERDTMRHSSWQDRQPDSYSDYSQFSRVSDSQDVQMTQANPVDATQESIRRLNVAERDLEALGFDASRDEQFPAPLPAKAWAYAADYAAGARREETSNAGETAGNVGAAASGASVIHTPGPAFTLNPYPKGKVPVDVFRQTEERLRTAYQQVYEVLKNKQAEATADWPEPNWVAVQLQPEWGLGGGARLVRSLIGLIDLVMVATRAYVVFVRTNVPVDPVAFQMRSTEVAMAILHLYHEIAQRDVANIERTRLRPFEG